MILDSGGIIAVGRHDFAILWRRQLTAPAASVPGPEPRQCSPAESGKRHGANVAALSLRLSCVSRSDDVAKIYQAQAAEGIGRLPRPPRTTSRRRAFAKLRRAPSRDEAERDRSGAAFSTNCACPSPSLRQRVDRAERQRSASRVRGPEAFHVDRTLTPQPPRHLNWAIPTAANGRRGKDEIRQPTPGRSSAVRNKKRPPELGGLFQLREL